MDMKNLFCNRQALHKFRICARLKLCFYYVHLLTFFEASTVSNVTPKVEYSVFLPNVWPGKLILYYNNVSFAPKTFGKRFLDKIDNSVKNLVLLT
jgi:hypothetical protein